MSRNVRFGSAKLFADGGGASITAQSGILSAILRENAGVYLVTVAQGALIQVSDVLRVTVVNAAGALSFFTAVERVSSSQFRVHITANGGGGSVATDTPWDLVMTRLQVG